MARSSRAMTVKFKGMGFGVANSHAPESKRLFGSFSSEKERLSF
jgi:hypothetical protein